MSVMVLNIVYFGIKGEGKPVDLPALNTKVIWSNKAISTADLYCYIDFLSYDNHQIIDSNALKVIYLTEPVSVFPNQYQRAFWKKFDVAITWNDWLAAQHPAFIHTFYPMYNAFSHQSISWLKDATTTELLKRQQAICLINNNKKSLIKGELFSLRGKVARWFYQDGQLPLDIYGRTPFNLPSYKGESPDKISTYKNYRYALCFENLYLENWSNGWITEKIFDAFYALTVPIYYGCYNIEDYIDPKCFIDYRQFNSLVELRDYLKNMSDETYLEYVTNIQHFLANNNPVVEYNWEKIYPIFVDLVQQHKNNVLPLTEWKNQPLPKDYLQTIHSFKEKLLFHFSCFLLKYSKLTRLVIKIEHYRKKLFNKLSCKLRPQKNISQNK